MNRISILIAVFVLVSAVNAQLPSSALTNVFPAGGQQGTKFDVTIAGRDLDGATRLEFSHPGINGEVKMQPATEFLPERPLANQFQVIIADNVPLGVHEVKAIGRFGASSVIPFLVRLNPTMVEAGNNQSMETAIPVDVDTTVFGRANANAKDYYRFAAKQGQQIFVECICDAIDSRLEPIVALHDSKGKVLKRSRSPKESQFAYSIPSDGVYLVSIHDHIFAGGNEHIYALNVSSAPRIEFILPAAGQPGTTSEFTVYGSNLPDGKESTFEWNGQKLQQKKINIFVPSADDLEPEVAQRSARLLVDTFPYQIISSQGVSNRISIGLASHPVIAELEPNDHTKPQRVSVPFELSGTFYPRRDQDWVRFAAKKDEQISVSLIGNRLGMESDPMVTIWRVKTDGQGKETLANINVTDDKKRDNGRFTRPIPRGLDMKSNDPELQFKAPADGDYCVSVRDHFGNARNNPKSVYRLVVQRPQPDFELVAWSQRFRRDGNNVRLERGCTVLRPGGTVVIPVDVVRRNGFTGDVAISASGFPSGLVCPEVVSKGGNQESLLFVTAAEDAPAWTGSIQITGTAKRGDETFSKSARYATVSSDTTNLASIRSQCRTTGQLTLTLVENEKAAASVAFSKPDFTTSLGGTLKLPFSYSKAEKMKGDLKLKAIGLPGQVKPKEVVLKPDAKDGSLELKISDPKTPLGNFQVYLAGQGVAIHARDASAIGLAENAKTKFDKVIADIVIAESAATTRRDEAKKAHAKLQAEISQLTESIRKKAELEKANQALSAATTALATAQQANQSGEQLEQLEAKIEASRSASAAQSQALETKQKELAAQQAKQTELDGRLAEAEKTLKAASEKKKRAEQHKKTLEDQLTNAKKSNAPKDIPIVVVSAPINIQIVKSPVEMKLKSHELKIEAGMHTEMVAELTIDLTRRYGFADSVQLETVPPKDSGLKPAALKLEKEVASGVIKITIGPDVKAGSYKHQLKAKLKFGGVDIEHPTDFQLTVLRK